MENVEIKKDEKKVEAPKKEAVKKQKADKKKVAFMEHMNKKRAEAGHKGAAYSEEVIKSYK